MNTLDKETDYREISQQYAQGAIKSVVLLNSGAIIALLSQISKITEYLSLRALSISFLLFNIGVIAGVSVWIFAFFSTRYVDMKIRGQIETYEQSDRWMVIGVKSLIASILLFTLGCFNLVLNLYFAKMAAAE